MTVSPPKIRIINSRSERILSQTLWPPQRIHLIGYRGCVKVAVEMLIKVVACVVVTVYACKIVKF